MATGKANDLNPNRGVNPFPTLVSSEETRILWAMPTAPVPPARRMGFISRSPQASLHTWPVSTIRGRAGRCREGGLSSTDERVRGHVTEVTQALWKSSEWSRVIHMYSRDDLTLVVP